jgi:N-acetylmuramoyl-L-alanine amidase
MALCMAVVVLACACYFAGDSFREKVSGTAQRSSSRLVILDAGHGGNDPGKIGVDGTLEKELNLVIAKKVQALLEQQDIEVQMTRETDDGLYDANASNKKVQDMKRRCEQINQAQPACVVSIHQNSYHEEAIHGAQVFYYETSAESRKLAEVLQEELISFVDPENHRTAKANDTYYLLKKTEVPIVIVECGFLSNWEESSRLKEENYQDKLAWAVQMGILKYLNGK